MPVEFAAGPKQPATTVITITSLRHSKSVGSRPPSGLGLFELAGMAIDNCGLPGDPLLDLLRAPAKVAATSTVANAFIARAIVAEAAAHFVEWDQRPPR